MTTAPADFSHWLKPKTVAAHFALKEDSAYRWIQMGTIPKKFVHRRGERGFIRVNPDVLPHLEKVFREAQGLAPLPRCISAAGPLQ